MRIGIIGAGHAGTEAAKAVREQGAEAVLFSAESVLPYYRPRLVALAFGQAELASIQMKPAAWYDQQQITLRLDCAVLKVDPATRGVTTSAGAETFDGLLIACGGVPVMPPFASACPRRITPLWNVVHADAIRKLTRAGGHLAIVGGGILGIEAALHARDAGMSVTIIEKMSRLMPVQFGKRASYALLRRLEEKGIRVILSQGVTAASETGDSLILTLEDGSALTSDFCLVSIGARPDRTLATGAGLACDRGMVVDHCLQTSVPGCAAAGDVIQFQGVTRCSMKESSAQGKLAALNLVARLRGQEGVPYVPETIPLTFKSKDFEIYAIGDTAMDGSEEHLLDGSTETLVRALVMKDGMPIGVQMIGTRDGFDAYAAQVRKSRKN